MSGAPRDLDLSRPIRRADPKRFSNIDRAKRVLKEVPDLHRRLVALASRMEACASELDGLAEAARRVKKELEEKDDGGTQAAP